MQVARSVLGSGHCIGRGDGDDIAMFVLRAHQPELIVYRLSFLRYRQGLLVEGERGIQHRVQHCRKKPGDWVAKSVIRNCRRSACARIAAQSGTA